MAEKPEKKRGPGRPKLDQQTAVLSLRVSQTTVQRVDSHAHRTGQTRNQAGAELIELGLAAAVSRKPSGGYDPKTASY